jgi:hypothetical protein
MLVCAVGSYLLINDRVASAESPEAAALTGESLAAAD